MPVYTTRHPTDAPPDNTPSESTALETRDHPHTAAALVQQGARIVRDYAALHDRETAVLKQLADVIVRLRACYQNNDGRPDLRGTSAGYRDAVQAIYYKADIPADSKSNMQAAVRYHIAQRLRVYMRAEGYTADDFEYYRLNPDDAAERNKRRARERTVRARQAVEMLSSATGNTAYRQQDITQLMGSTPDDAASPAPNPDELAALVTAASARFRELVSRAELDALVRLKHSEREKLREELDALETAAALVRSYL